MSDKSPIEWTEATWNPVTGCTPIPGVAGRPSGCDHCYARTLIDRRMSKNPNSVRFGHPFAEVMTHEDRLAQPFRWKRPRRIFVNSLSDLFHKDVPDELIAQVFATMAFAAQHTYQVLTKRPERMRRLLAAFSDGRALGHALSLPVKVHGDRIIATADLTASHGGVRSASHPWPIPHVHVGVSISTNDDAWRADMLRETPSGVRWVSAEPLLGPLDKVDLTGIDWVVVGGESGHGARPMHPQWARDLRDRCVDAGIPYFFKQWGSWKPISEIEDSDALYDPLPENNPLGRQRCKVETGILQLDGEMRMDFPKGAMQVFRVGKKAAGRELDGKTWDEHPAIGGAA
jgi:protein gp37